MSTSRRQVPLAVAVLVTGFATAFEAVAPAETFPSWAETAIHVVWKLGVLAAAIGGFIAVERRMPTLPDFGIVGSDVPRAERARRRHVAGRWMRAAWLVMVLVAATGRGAGTGYGESGSVGVLAGVFLLRWPVSVIAQQVLFFGWLQPRLGRYGIPIAAALYTAYHLAQDSSLLYIAPLGGIFALLRWQTGSICAGSVLHYGINAVLFLLAS